MLACFVACFQNLILLSRLFSKRSHLFNMTAYIMQECLLSNFKSPVCADWAALLIFLCPFPYHQKDITVCIWPVTCPRQSITPRQSLCFTYFPAILIYKSRWNKTGNEAPSMHTLHFDMHLNFRCIFWILGSCVWHSQTLIRCLWTVLGIFCGTVQFRWGNVHLNYVMKDFSVLKWVLISQTL